MGKFFMTQFRRPDGRDGDVQIRIILPDDTSAIIGRLYKKHLTDEEFDKVFAGVLNIIEKLNLP